VERALYQLGSCQMPIESFKVRSVGRTDKGVHAKEQMVCFDYSFHKFNTGSAPNILEAGRENSIPLNKKQKTQSLNEKYRYDVLFRKCSTAGEKNSSYAISMIRSFNSYLPEDVAVKSIQRCRLGLQPRKEASWKIYAYQIRYEHCNLAVKPPSKLNRGVHSIRSPFDRYFTWTCPWSLDSSILNDLCQNLSGFYDYYNFVHKKERNKKEHKMQIQIQLDMKKESFSEKYDEMDQQAIENSNLDVDVRFITVRFKSKDGFRRSMVRNLVGFMVDGARGKFGEELNAIRKGIFTPNDKTAAYIHSAPACGLCLEKVQFIHGIFP